MIIFKNQAFLLLFVFKTLFIIAKNKYYPNITIDIYPIKGKKYEKQ